MINATRVVELSLRGQVGLAWRFTSFGRLLAARGQYEQARVLLTQSLVLFGQEADFWGIALSLEGLSLVALGRHDYVRVACLAGAAAALLEGHDVELFPSDQAQREHALSKARAYLGEIAFAEAYAQGRAMTPKQAIAYALEEHVL